MLGLSAVTASVSRVCVLVRRFCLHGTDCLLSPIDPAVQRCEDGGGASSGEEGPTDSDEAVGSPESDDESNSEGDSEGVDDGDSDNDSDSDVAAEQFGSDLESSDEDTGTANGDHLGADVAEELPAEVAPSLTTPHIPYTFEGEGGLASPCQE